MVNGWNRFHSATDDTKHIGFTRNGRAIRFFNRTTRPYENCYNFQKTKPSAAHTTLRSPISSTSFTSINSTTAISTGNGKPKHLHTMLSNGRSVQTNRLGKPFFIYYLP